MNVTRVTNYTKLGSKHKSEDKIQTKGLTIRVKNDYLRKSESSYKKIQKIRITLVVTEFRKKSESS